VGIRDDLVSRDLSKSQANAGLKAYCRRGVYRDCLVAGERIDLDGNAAGVVTEAEAAQATVTPKRTATTPEKPQDLVLPTPPMQAASVDGTSASDAQCAETYPRSS
jgi:ProP effector